MSIMFRLVSFALLLLTLTPAGGSGQKSYQSTNAARPSAE